MSLPKDLPKNYNFAEVEPRWQGIWRDEDHYFDRTSPLPQFVIDTPPPYPTGTFHIGNAFNWCYIDFIARYKRMRGYNVMFPQGWDCHGLPTEVKVEEIHGITKNDVPREKFREMCRELTLSNIGKMRLTLRKLGFSVDWSNEYITMLPEYYKKTQISFLKMLASGYIYQSEHPVNFCTRCETAIAFAEVVYEPRETLLNYFDFNGVEIATTRPELLAACVAVAVHPADERYKGISGLHLKVPIFGHEVPVIADEAVDPAFGSGAVMICTFGDKQDVFWWKQHHLELRKAIDRTGRMTSVAGKYQNIKSGDCREAILSDMKDLGILLRQEPLEQRVGTCWRCKTPIEIMSERQWFVKIVPDEIMEAAREVKWTPGHMFLRMENWISQMEWDWCISRQRIFATPIPVWFCAGCGEMILPAEADLPLDPTVRKPDRPCEKCGSTDVIGEEDVLDTWMDSSISVLNVTGWDGTRTPEIFPAQIRPQGHDIIRTWAFYTILRAVALTGRKPWDEILVNGMVLGEDGFKMSKSRGNIISPEEIIETYGSDAFRQWAAAGAATGSDIMFNWNDVIAASRFQTKLWNVARFILLQLEKKEFDHKKAVTAPVDRWLLAKLAETTEEVTDAVEQYQFDRGLKALREFSWNVLADNYIELVKGRLYSDDPSRDAACRVLWETLDSLCRMMAPYAPHFSEEIYSHLNKGSVHTKSWPEKTPLDQEARDKGDLLVRLVSDIRRFKHEKGLALNAPMGRVTLFTSHISDDGGDMARALNAKVEWRTDTSTLEKKPGEITFDMAVIGPALRKDAKAFMDAVRALPGEILANPPAMISIGGKQVEVPAGSFSQQSTYMVGGESVDLIMVDDVIVTVQKNP
ncbi:MAG: valine--tRNA ligase [Methanoregulaceae archaeon]|nr:valine--tRNA ligase [Methanoregulaceae archaeon]